MLKKYAAILSYEGTRYCGWQRQKGSAAEGAPSLQETIETVLSKITSEPISIVGSGRTDAGVHATGQVMHFVLNRKEWDPPILMKGLNSQLPPDIRVLHLENMDSEFHAQRSALKKQYSYFFQQGSAALPHLMPYSWWIRKKLNIEAMQEALSDLVGAHDFLPFRASGAAIGTTVREILEAEVSRENITFPRVEDEISLVRIRLVGTGFLKQMVRGIAGTLLQIGEEYRPASAIREILKSLDRSDVGPTAPARALWLEKVWYPNGFGD